MEYYAAMKKERGTDMSATWLDLKGVVLSENSRSPEAARSVTPCPRRSGKGRVEGTENASAVARGVGTGRERPRGEARGSLGTPGLPRLAIVVADAHFRALSTRKEGI